MELDIIDIKQNGLIFRINQKEKTAKIVGYYITNKDIVIPRLIKHNSQEFIVDCISNRSFWGKSIVNIEFSAHSAVSTIEKAAFLYSCLESITIPPSVCELAESWCIGTKKLIHVTIMPNNKRYKNYTDNMIIGKSDTNRDEYDILVFVCRNAKSIEIPPFIKEISPYSLSESLIENVFIPPQITRIGDCAFLFCKNLKKVEIPINSQLRIIGNKSFMESSIESIFIPSHINILNEGMFSYCNKLRTIEFASDSELKIIKKDAFAESSIESISIPQGVSELQEGWCSKTSHLRKVTIIPNNKYYKHYDNKIIIGRKDVRSDVYDTLVFAQRNIKSIRIPKFIKVISKYSFAYSSIESVFVPSSVSCISEHAFYSCKNLRKVEINKNSKIHSIESNTFSYSGIETFSILPQISKVSECAFFMCKKLHLIGLTQNSRLQEIGSSSFVSSSIKSFYIPAKVTEINNTAFLCRNLIIIEIDEYCESLKICRSTFSFCKYSIIMFPVKFIDNFI